MKILFAALFILALFAILRVAAKILNILADKGKWAERAIYAFPAFEFIAWLILIFWLVEFLFYGTAYYTYLVLSITIVLIAGISWFIVKDFIAGIVIRGQSKIKEDQLIQVNGFSGKVIRLGLTALHLENAAGQNVTIPYTKLSHEAVTEEKQLESADQYKFQIEAPASLPQDEFIKLIRFVVLNTAWALPNRDPQITLITENKAIAVYEISIAALNKKHLSYVKQKLQEKIMAL